MQISLLDKTHALLVIILGIILLVLHTFTTIFTIDLTSIYLLIIIAILPYLRYASKISFGDNSVDLERDVKKVAEEVNEVTKEGTVEETQNEDEQFNAFVKYIKDIAIQRSDPDLAIMKLRTELELAVKQVYINQIQNAKATAISISGMVTEMHKQNLIDDNTLNATVEVTSIANRIVHGEHIKPEYTSSMIDTTLQLIAFYYRLQITLENIKTQNQQPPKTENPEEYN
jgi:hypothetical protein